MSEEHSAEQDAREWPCANYTAPMTCLTAPSSETARCDWCRAAAGSLADAEKDAACRCGHALHDDTCDCGCEWDSAFCPRCGWIDCECPSARAFREGEINIRSIPLTPEARERRARRLDDARPTPPEVPMPDVDYERIKAQARAEALREAADGLYLSRPGQHNEGARNWLHRRANLIDPRTRDSVCEHGYPRSTDCDHCATERPLPPAKPGAAS